MTPEPPDKGEIIASGVERLSRSPKTLEEQLKSEEFHMQVQKLIPGGARRYVRITLNAILRNKQLAQCTQASFFKCALELAGMGLEPDGRRAHLIPFRNRKSNTLECTLIVDYKGLVELVYRSGQVSAIHADVVYANDEWDCEQGSEAHLRHRLAAGARGNELVCAYSFIKFKDGSESFDVMSPAEIEKIRARSKTPNEGPWVTDTDEMRKKTVFRRHQKWLPLLSPEVREAVDAEDEEISVDTTGEWVEDAPAGKKRRSASDVLNEQTPFAPDPAPAGEGGES